MGKIIVEIADEMHKQIKDITEFEMALTDSEIIRSLLKVGIEQWLLENKKVKK